MRVDFPRAAIDIHSFPFWFLSCFKRDSVRVFVVLYLLVVSNHEVLVRVKGVHTRVAFPRVAIDMHSFFNGFLSCFKRESVRVFVVL